MDKMATIKCGCPLCNGDVVGNEKYMYLCKNCFILFREEHLNKES